jgi:hypothetical protein
MINEEVRSRIRLSLAAYAYEVKSESILTDSEFDRLSLEIDPSVSTGNDKLDQFFREVFDPNTGLWILKHPELNKLADLYDSLYNKQGD